MRCRSSILMMLALVLVFSFQISTADDSLYCFEEPLALSFLGANPIDTAGMVIIFYVDGCNVGDTCRYDPNIDSLNFRNIRSEMPIYAEDLVDTTISRSIINYFKAVSSDKHLLRAAVVPTGDTAYMCDSCETRWSIQNDIDVIFEQADQDIDFGDYDLTGENDTCDGYVDMVALVCLNKYDTGGRAFPSFPVYKTDDTNENGDTVYIAGGDNAFYINVWNYADQNPWDPDCDSVGADYARLAGLLEHEYGHHFGYVDLDHRGYSLYQHTGVGSFGIMGRMFGFDDRTSPVNALYRDAFKGISNVEYEMDWIDPIVVENEPRYSQKLEINLFTDSSAYILRNSEVSQNQHFILTAHDFASDDADYFELKLPTPDSGGVMIWHVDTTSSGTIYDNSDEYHKTVDVEIALGLYDWPNDTMDTDSPNPELGLDSLDFVDVWAFTYPVGDVGSKNCYFDGYTYGSFDHTTNPSSKFYKTATVDSQVVESRISIRNLLCYPDSIAADLLVNHWYDSLTATTIWGDSTQETGYAITGDFIIPEACTLTIRKGTKIYFQADDDDKSSGINSSRCELIVYGTLIAEGDSANHIAFIPSSEQLGTAAVQDWYGIRFMANSRGDLDYCDIENCYYGIYMYDTSYVSIDNCTFKDSHYSGVRNNKGELHANNCTFEDHNYGILSYYAQSEIDSSTFIDCKYYGINAQYQPAYSLDSTIVTNCSFRTGESSVMIGSLYGVRAYSIDDIRIENNTIRTYGQGGIYLYNTDAVVLENSVNLCDYYGIYSTNSSNGLIWFCNFDSLDYGIYLSNSAINTIDSCKFDSVDVGIRVYGNQQPDLGDYASGDTTEWGFNDFEFCETYYIQQVASSFPGPLITAEMNYYGDSVEVSKFSGNIDYNPYLNTDPRPKLIINQPLPSIYSLANNYPNPFNPQTAISFTLAEPGYATITVYNVLGQIIAKPIEGFKNAGEHTVMWDGRNSKGEHVASGVYFYQLDVGDYVESKKMLLLR